MPGFTLTGTGVVVRNPDRLYVGANAFARVGLRVDDQVDNIIEGKKSIVTVLWFAAIGDIATQLWLHVRKRDTISITASARESCIASNDYGMVYMLTSVEVVASGKPTYPTKEPE